MATFSTIMGKLGRDLRRLFILVFILAIVAGSLAVYAYAFWCIVIAFSGGTIPVLGWKLYGGFWTGLLWMFVVSPMIVTIGNIILKLLIAGVRRIDPEHLPQPRPARVESSAEDPAAYRTDGLPRSNLPSARFGSIPFDADAESYSQKNAEACAAVAYLAYSPREVIECVAQASGVSPEGIHVIEIVNHTCVVLMRSDVLIVAFRGTNDLKDWRTNLRSKAKPGYWGKVHSGYESAVELLWGELDHWAWARVTEQQTVWITGHSMGGALATLATAKRLVEGGKVAGLYTFGQPTVGDEEFNRELESHLGPRYYRFAHVADIAVDKYTFKAFRHTGQLKYIDRGGRIQDGETRRMDLDGILARMFNSLGRMPAPFSDHRMREYLVAIIRNADGAATLLDAKEKYWLCLWVGFNLALLGGLAYLWWTTSAGVLAFFFVVSAVMVLAHVICAIAFPRAYFDHLRHLVAKTEF